MTIDELRQIAETERAAQRKYSHRLYVCIAAGCLSSGSDHVRQALKQEAAQLAALEESSSQ